MGVLDTTYTFTATDVVTSAKLNNVIDQTTFTSSAFSGTTLAINGSGQLRVNASGITSLELADNSVNTAKILDANVTTAKIADANITQAKIATNVVGKGPFFLAGKVGTQSLTGVYQTITDLSNEVHDTNNSYDPATSTFTVPIAGYYLLMGLVTTQTAAQNLAAQITVNGNDFLTGEQVSATTLRAVVSGIRYLVVNDLIQLKASVTGTVVITGATFEGCLIRSA